MDYYMRMRASEAAMYKDKIRLWYGPAQTREQHMAQKAHTEMAQYQAKIRKWYGPTNYTK